MPKEDNKFTIKIESILGGESLFRNFAKADQYQSSLAIDPDMPDSDSGTASDRPSGFLRPVGNFGYGGAALTGAPMWMTPTPKNSLTYVYLDNGSTYTASSGSLTGLGDLNDGGTSAGNGSAYYDNYVYFARDTTIARYGPLDGTAAFIDDYWVTTLSKTALTANNYPFLGINEHRLPNHIMHRHRADGRLYFADVVDNRGTLHYISTNKTTVEGDNDNGSTY